MSNSPGRCCPRCRESLPEGTNFCVACGYYNPDPMLDKTASVTLEIGKRQGRMKFWLSWIRALLWSRILR